MILNLLNHLLSHLYWFSILRLLFCPPPQAILQAVTFRAPAEGTSPAVEISTYAQRAVWNTQAANEQMCVLMVDDYYGISWNIIEIVLSFSWDIVYNWVTVAKKEGIAPNASAW